MDRRVLSPAAAWLFGLCACSGASSGPPRPPSAQKTAAPIDMVSPSRLLPEIDENEVAPWLREEGRSKFLVAGLRVEQSDDGTVERGDERLPSGALQALPLPQRLGGGYLFYLANSQGTRLWRADRWIGKLRPLVSFAATADDVIAGFDRLYLRTRTGQALLAFDPEGGALMSLGGIPEATGWGAMAFADGWRGLCETDLAGPMVSFDAGVSWRPLPLPSGADGPAMQIVSAGVLDGDPALFLSGGGYYRVGARGDVQLVTGPSGGELTLDGASEPERAAARPLLGRRPLRMAVERGWPEAGGTALVAHRGALARVHLPDGAIVAAAENAFAEDDAECTAARVGRGFGFVCGRDGGETVIYALAPPLALREVARFSEPRFVAASGNGALVVRGSCEPAGGVGNEARSYCIVAVDGTRREVVVRGDVGAERVIALADGRVVVLAPPRLGADGRLTLIDGAEARTVDLKIPEAPRDASKIARRGLWLEGFEERGKGAIGGWVEAGGPVVGVKVKLDGTVVLGTPYDKGGEPLLSGRFALAVNPTEGASESTDGGMSWQELELPQLPASEGASRTRGCSPVGCSLLGWVRVGWGAPRVERDLALAAEPDELKWQPLVPEPLRLRCVLTDTVAPVASDESEPEDGGSEDENVLSEWSSFRGSAAPKLQKGDSGVDKGTASYEAVPAHVYVWGPKGADWTRAGWWSIRFEDRFDPGGGIRTSGATRPPWADEVAAAEAIGAMRRGSYLKWIAEIDPAGTSALMNVCAGLTCLPFAVSEGRPLLPLKRASAATPELQKPLPHGVARVGESWYLLTEEESGEILLWRGDLGVLRLLRRFQRLDKARYGELERPRLVRRARGGELGLLLTVPPDPTRADRVGRWMVLPLDAHSGAFGEPIPLGATDLGGRTPRACAEQDDGWLVDTKLGTGSVVVLEGLDGALDDIEYRLRLAPGGGCVVAIAARVGRRIAAREPVATPRRGVRPAAVAVPAGYDIPLSARDRYTAERWSLRCARGGDDSE